MPTCGEFFNSTYGFEMHRKPRDWFVGIGQRAAMQLGYPRRCLTVQEMQAEGMQKSKTDYWISESFENAKEVVAA